MTFQRFFRTLLPSLCALGISLGVQADSLNIKPGLWEHQMSMKSESGQLEQQLEMVRQQMEAMPPAQKKMMEDMMAKQGLSMDFSSQTVRNCLTEEEAARGEFEWGENTNCEHNVVSRGDQTRIEFTCPDDNAQGEMVLDGDSAYTGQSTALVDFGGTPEKVTITHSGQWVSADCP
ncbi:DUF3617 domain-containing protein [Marinimicrobium sp. C6131]|uniref:DUF3617 domain-containing protein n=1 Tax=Marinimicrobium sp. C6131 TaxID=3022676 RepID=UPI00223CEACB|nr:DUF3617 domain-containing protein [Marinimicrobium sp. C6131]UZJ46055.1 DUF3617 domain-containing protein [Marinimicrobium sp. C6131]